jgi:hypothetical protein
MSKWEAEKAERNRRSIARLTKSLPGIFPSAVLSRALGRPFVPPTPPRLAIDSYWNAHPLRADRLARALASRSGAPSGWTWRVGIAGTMACQPHSERHQRPIGNAHTRRSRILLYMRATGLSLRLACRPMERRPKQECDLALRLCGRMAILDRTK